MRKLSELLSDQERQAIRGPIESARTLPRRAFIDPDFYAYELEHVLRESWVAVGFSTAVVKPGDVLPLTILGIPMLLVRNQNGGLNAFHNVCPYDGCEVSMRRQHGVAAIVTPYHGWHYDLNGKLTRAGYFDGSADAEGVDLAGLNADLVSMPCVEWLSTIFVYPGKRPISFQEQYRAVFDHLSYLDLDRIEIGVDENSSPLISNLSVQTNWKTSYENYSPNVYHESFVHAMYRNSPLSPRVDERGNKTYTEINDPSGYLGLSYDSNLGSAFYGASKLPFIRTREGDPNPLNTIANVFPNWVTTILRDVVRISIFLPDGPENGTQLVATMFDKTAATDPALAEDRMDSMKKGIIARKEDNVICESIQRARHSPAVETGFYSPFWDAMHYTLSNLVLDKLEAGEQTEAN